MRVRTATGWTETWTPAFQFTVSPALPLAPALVSPGTGYLTNNNRPSFSWNGVANAATYEIQIDNLATFAIPVDITGSGLTGTSFAPETDLADGLKYWRVRAINSLDIPGAWSLARTITIDTVAPLPPTLSTPADNAPGIRTTPTFSWLAVATANAYQFQYDEASDFANPAYTSGDCCCDP